MKIIAHRGNLYGPNPETENTVEQAEKCFALGFDVELDIWAHEGLIYAGHDKPKHRIPMVWIIENIDKIYFHCKDQYAYAFIFGGNGECFFHENDQIVCTSKGGLWFYPGAEIQENSRRSVHVKKIACLPETIQDWDIAFATHICTDYPIWFQKEYEDNK